MSQIPDLHFLVITDRREDVLVKVVPGYVLNNGAVSLKVEYWILIELILIGLIDVPDTNPLVVRSTEQESFLHWVPSQSVSFLSMPCQTEIWFDLVVNRSFWMFVIIKEIDFTIYRFGRYYLLILWHISCSVNFT